MDELQKKLCDDSLITLAHVMQPADANPAGNVHGGVIMKLIDNAAGVAAARHARANVVTASIDRLDFHNPVYVGDLVTLMASINLTGRTSMEVGVRVESENLLTGARRHTASAYLTFVALDPAGKPHPIPQLVAVTDDQKRRQNEAEERRAARLAEKARSREKAAPPKPNQPA
ncbi:MAG: acyl-CoA thioesterase [Thermodesulfobacteriota bacterium]